MKVVCNASPIIFLAKLQRLGLLVQLYGTLLIPSDVLSEIRAKPGTEQEQLSPLLENERCLVRKASEQSTALVPADLGAGERGVIALALEVQADLVVLDDQYGRRIAQQHGLPVTGTVGILIEAYARGLIPSVRYEIDRLIGLGMWVSDAFYQRLVEEFGE